MITQDPRTAPAPEKVEPPWTQPFAWMQHTTGTLHTTPNCSAARRTRYGLARVEDLEDLEVSHAWCRRCAGDRPPTQARSAEDRVRCVCEVPGPMPGVVCPVHDAPARRQLPKRVVPEWIRRRNEGQLLVKDMTGAGPR